MYAKQYEITLPADYDMAVIRQRVAAAAPVLDDRAGLGLKAYLVRERAGGGSPVNQYAPFYLWHDTAAMGQFLAGRGGFENIIRSFGRPRVLHWTVAATFAGPDRGPGPVGAYREFSPIEDDGLEVADHLDQAVEQARELARRAGVHTAAVAFDPYHWQLVTFALWQGAIPADLTGGDHFEVLHVSEPGLAAIPDGRHW